MAGKKSPRRTPAPIPRALLADALTEVCTRGHDLVVTFETCDDGRRLLHLMTGHLITPCMLGTLTNRCDLPGGDGNRHRTLPLR